MAGGGSAARADLPRPYERTQPDLEVKHTPYVAVYTCPLFTHPREHPANASFFERDRSIVRDLEVSPPSGLVRFFKDLPDPAPWPGYVGPEGAPASTLSVWSDLASVFAFSYREGRHHEALRHRRDWFRRLDHPTYALWYVDDPSEATYEEAARRLDHLVANGPAPYAFDFRHPFDPEGRPLSADILRQAAPDDEPSGGPAPLRFKDP